MHTKNIELLTYWTTYTMVNPQNPRSKAQDYENPMKPKSKQNIKPNSNQPNIEG